MKYTLLILVISISIVCAGCQLFKTSFTYPEVTYNIRDSNYIDFILIDHHVWAIGQDGCLVIWDIKTGSVQKEQYPLQGLTWIQKTPQHDVYVGSHTGKISKFDSVTNQWNMVYSLTQPAFGVCIFDEATHYAVTNNGVIDLLTGEQYRPEQSMNTQFDYQTMKIIGEPSTICCDSKRNIWIGYDKGEWGGNVHVFNTTSKKYLPLTIDIDDFVYGKLRIPLIEVLPVVSIFEGQHHSIYLTSGLQHFGIHGAILQFQDTDSHNDLRYIGASVFMAYPSKEKSGEYIGPGYFNPYDNKLYYYSNEGFHFLDQPSDNSEPLKHVFLQPTVTWQYGRSNAVGYQMSILKFEFLDEHTMVFLSRLDGIGVFNGENITFYK